MTSGWRRGLPAVTVAALAAGVLATTSMAAGAQAATRVPGNDYSWPQCPVGVGNGQGAPLPGGTHTFAVVGLTNGAGLHENPCLAAQWRYARGHASYVTGYGVLTFPTRAQRVAANTGHYGACTTYDCRLRNSGWAQADFTDASLRRLGAHPPLVWVDVEPRDRPRWTSNRRWNSEVIRAAIAGLQSHGYAVGIYSNRRMWRQIAGYRTSLREWVPAGGLSYGCRLSFGGAVWLSQLTHYYSATRVYDENGVCGRAPALRRWFQRGHPTVTTQVDSTSGAATARFDGGRPVPLQAVTVDAPSVVAVPTVAGDVPLFAALLPGQGVWVRTLSSAWRSLPSECSSTPSLAVSGHTLYLGCTAADGTQTVTSVALNRSGAPTGTPTVSPYDPSAPADTPAATSSPSPSPSPTLVAVVLRRSTSAYLR